MGELYKILSTEESYTYFHFLRFPMPAVWRADWGGAPGVTEVRETRMSRESQENTKS